MNCLSLVAFVFNYLRLDITAKRKKGLDDHLLVACHAPVHRLDLHLGVRLNLCRDVVLAAHVLCLIVLERLLPFCLVPLNFSLGLGKYVEVDRERTGLDDYTPEFASVLIPRDYIQ